MNGALWAEDFKGIIGSKRTAYSLLIMAAFAVLIAIVVRYAPEGLRIALESAAPSSSGLFEYLWVEDVLDKLLLLIFISYGSYAICDLEDEKTLELNLTRAKSRFEVISRRFLVSLSTMALIFLAGSLVAGAIAGAIVGSMDVAAFLAHQALILPMCLFVFSFTFLLSVPLRTTTPTVITSFAITLALSFTYSFLLMAGDVEPSILNPMAMGYRVLLALPIEGAVAFALACSCAMTAVGMYWFSKKDY